MPRDRKVYYFEASARLLAVLAAMRKAGFIKTDISRMEFHFSEIREDNGDSSYARIINKDFMGICASVKEEILKNNRAVNAITAAAGKQDKGLMYFLRRASSDIRRKVILINAIDWYARTGKIKPGSSIEYIVTREPFTDILKSYAAQKGIKIKSRFPEVKKTLDASMAAFIFVIVLPLKDLFASLIKSGERADIIKRESGRKVAVFYSGRVMTFDPKKRCDYFWLLVSDYLWPKTLIYSIYSDKDLPVSDRAVKIREIRGQGMGFLPLVKEEGDSPGWTPAFRYFGILFKLNFFTCVAIFKDLLHARSDFLYFAKAIFSFSRAYAFWSDFFRVLGLRVNFSPPDYDPTTLIINIAMENEGGVSMGYQIADFEAPDLVYSSRSDVFFAFGPFYADKMEQAGADVENLVFCGYLTDYIFKEVKADSEKLRESLAAKGADFIVSYFDENSSDNCLALIKSSAAAHSYKKLFERVIKDKGFGLICKPKKPRSLRKRLPAIADLMDKAIATGRCVFLDEGDYISSRYPSEAAQASDMAIGMFHGGTTALESFLSGVPTVYLDLEKKYTKSGRNSPKDYLVFDSMEGLFGRIDEFRRDRQTAGRINAAFEQTIEGKDPFRDGRASERVGGYVRDIIELLDKGAAREDAIGRANALYRQKWGAANIINMGIKNDQA